MSESTSNPPSRSSRSSSESPMSLDYSADCSSSRNVESCSDDASSARLVHSRPTEFGQYEQLWRICKPFFSYAAEAESARSSEHLHHDSAAVCDRTQNNNGGSTNNRKGNFRDASSFSSSMDESDITSASPVDPSRDDAHVAGPHRPQQGRDAGAERIQAGQLMQQQLEHLPRPKVVSDNTGSGGSNRDCHKHDTNSTESNSGGDDGLGNARDSTKQEETPPTLDTGQKHDQSENKYRHRLAVKKRKRLDQRRDFEEAGQHTRYSSSSEGTSTADSPNGKVFKPVGRPITLEEALAFTHMARVVVLGVSPFLIVHANAAFHRLIGSGMNTFIINKPLSSFIHMPHASKAFLCGREPFVESYRNDSNCAGYDITSPTTFQNLLTTCGHGDALPIHIFLKRDPTSQQNDTSSFNHGSGDKTINTMTESMVSCYMTIRPVIKELSTTWPRQNRGSTHLCGYNKSNFNVAIHGDVPGSLNHTEQTISHYVIHMRLKDETPAHKTVHPDLSIQNGNMKTDSDSCSSSGTKPIMACA